MFSCLHGTDDCVFRRPCRYSGYVFAWVSVHVAYMCELVCMCVCLCAGCSECFWRSAELLNPDFEAKKWGERALYLSLWQIWRMDGGQKEVFSPPFMCPVPLRKEQQGRFLYVCDVCVRTEGSISKTNSTTIWWIVMYRSVSLSSRTIICQQCGSRDGSIGQSISLV